MKFLIVLICLVAVPAQAKEVLKTAKTSVSERMYTYFSWDKQCKSTIGVVELVTKPQNGTLKTSEVEEKINKSRSRPGRVPACKGVPIRGFRIDYTSNAGFKGVDRFRTKVNYKNKTPEIDNFTVMVK